MKPTLKKQQTRIVKASRAGWPKFVKELKTKANNKLVKADWKVTYDELGHDILIDAQVSVVDPKDCLLQVWLQDLHPGVWIPENRPWVASAVEFNRNQGIQTVKLGLFDSKWRPEDVGQTYRALLWGYLQHGATVESFTFDAEFVYPG